ncbi:uncharacterized mitochondrial protein AtMg00820-like [Magnolia sinica]|uniref:uncharacterized mitochondrial protein AtMg00820-like n=1 Tax=Magnolia sinica TaxID=86752 RepID=UPI00265B27A5|nr:uncharacterized mitochondrial protein AtMg00820-like [Magnolia sinica]
MIFLLWSRKSIQDALSNENSKRAMDEEMEAMYSGDMWKLTNLPSGETLVNCRWVYTVKILPDGSIDRYKAKLVAKRSTQIYGLDVKNMFLHEDLHEEVYMEHFLGMLLKRSRLRYVGSTSLYMD